MQPTPLVGRVAEFGCHYALRDMTIALYPFMVLAAIGLLLSLGVHIMTLALLPIPGGGTVWALHIGIFVVWIPTVLVARRMTRQASRRDFWRATLRGCPGWMRTGVHIFFGYAFVNFALFFIGTVGHPKPTGAAPPVVVRGFSGHWMFFYSAAFATLYSAIHASHLLRDRRCPRGHAVSHTATFCPDCGAQLESEGRDA